MSGAVGSPQSISENESLISADTFSVAYGEPLDRTLDIDSWQTGGDLEGLYERLEREVRAAVEIENTQRETIRRDGIEQ
jgi:hypothetical protein